MAAGKSPPDGCNVLQVESPRFSGVLEGVSRHYKACYVPLSSEAEVDAQVARWMKKAYRFGVQEHLAGPKTKRKGSR